MITLSRQLHEWGFVCGQIAAFENELLPKEFFNSLASVERIEDLLHRLQDTALRDYVTPGAAWEEWNDLIDRHFHGQVGRILSASPLSALTDLFLLPGDYLNLKRALLGMGSYPFEKGLFSESILHAVNGGDLSLLPDWLRRELAPLITNTTGLAAPPTPALDSIDILLDGVYLRHMIRLARETGAALIEAYVSDLALGKSIIALWRSLSMEIAPSAYETAFLPIGEHTPVLRLLMDTPDPKAWPSILGGPIGQLLRQAQDSSEDPPVQVFELLLANHLMQRTRQAKMQTMGPERAGAYLVGLHAQAYNLKLVISGRFNGIDPDILKRRLRECYV